MSELARSNQSTTSRSSRRRIRLSRNLCKEPDLASLAYTISENKAEWTTTYFAE